MSLTLSNSELCALAFTVVGADEPGKHTLTTLVKATRIAKRIDPIPPVITPIRVADGEEVGDVVFALAPCVVGINVLVDSTSGVDVGTEAERHAALVPPYCSSVLLMAGFVDAALVPRTAPLCS